jgi:hypothetical protein
MPAELTCLKMPALTAVVIAALSACCQSGSLTDWVCEVPKQAWVTATEELDDSLEQLHAELADFLVQVGTLLRLQLARGPV